VRQIKQKIGGSSTDRQFREVMCEYGIDPSVAINTGLRARIEKENTNYLPKGTSLKEQRVAHIHHPGLVAALERYDRVAASCGVEARHPLLDKRLVEFSLAIPGKQSGSQGWSKYLMRRVAARYLPPEVAWRTSADDNGGEFILSWVAEQQQLLGSTIESSGDLLRPYGFKVRKSSNDLMEQWGTFCLISWQSHITKSGCSGIIKAKAKAD
jgi:asparagine synthetase B (glutamine-hydrolysing)